MLNKHAVQGVKLTNNFSLIEFIEGKAMPSEAIAMNYNKFPIHLLPRIGVISKYLQDVRDITKVHFGDRFKGIQINCGLRVKEWELLQGRSGNSQHCQGWASDITPICAEEDFEEIFEWIYKHIDNNHNGGLGYYPKSKFLHIDMRITKARW